MSRLQEILDKKRVQDRENPFNFVQFGSKRLRCFLDSFDLDAFWRLYEKAMENNESFCLAEKPLPQSVLRLDVDISVIFQHVVDNNLVEFDASTCCYSDEQIVELVSNANSLIDEMFVNVDKSTIQCFLLEKSARLETKTNSGVNQTRVKRGFHLHWPLIVANEKDQKSWLNRLIAKANEEQIFPPGKCPIDENSLNVNWLLYGSRKPNETGPSGLIKHEPYKISRAYDFDGFEIDCETLGQRICLQDAFDESKFLENVSIYRKMSIRPYGRKSIQLKPSISTFAPIQFSKFSELQFSTPPNLQHIEELVKMLDFERCCDYKKWLNVGRCLFTIVQGAEEGLYLWDDWSMKCVEKYSPSSCENKWRTFTVGTYGILLLKSWARTDNSEAFAKWENGTFLSSLNEFKNYSSGEIARLGAKIAGDNYKFCRNEWFEFSGHHWKCLTSSNNIPILQFFNSVIRKFVMAAFSKFAESESKENASKNFGQVIKKLDEPNSLESILTMFRLVYQDENFKDVLNSNQLLVGLKNGVYDLEKCEFRDGRQEDFISKSVACNYLVYDMDSPEIKNVEMHLQRFFPNQSRRKYMLDILCQVFIGNLYLKNLFLWVGVGDNGKTAFGKWIEEMMGLEYCVKMPTTLLSSAKNEPGKASPELIRLKGKKVAFFDEPDSDETLRNGFLKNFTGRDSMEARDLYQKGSEMTVFTPTALGILICNKEPEVKNPEDNALWNRIRVCEFESCFVEPEKAPQTIEEQLERKIFPSDPDFVNKVKKLTEPLCYYLLEHWRKTKGKDLDTPECIVAATQNYKNSNNHLTKFKGEYLVESENDCEFNQFKDKYMDFLRMNTANFNVTNSKLIEDLRKLGVNVVSKEGIYVLENFVLRN